MTAFDLGGLETCAATLSVAFMLGMLGDETFPGPESLHGAD